MQNAVIVASLKFIKDLVNYTIGNLATVISRRAPLAVTPAAVRRCVGQRPDQRQRAQRWRRPERLWPRDADDVDAQAIVAEGRAVS